MLIVKYVKGAAGTKLTIALQVSSMLMDNGCVILAKILHRYVEKRFGVYISVYSKIGKNISFPHPVGIVIGAGVIIGNNCIIYQGVTLGGARAGDAFNNNYPILGDNVVVYAGAQVLGAIKVGSCSVIGANSVVLKNVPENSVVVGVPAKVIKKMEVAN